jgi:hypothetical protein
MILTFIFTYFMEIIYGEISYKKRVEKKKKEELKLLNK